MRNDIFRKCDAFKAESLRQLAMARAKFPNTRFIEFDAGSFWAQATAGINPVTKRPWVTDRGCLTSRPAQDSSLACPAIKAFEPITPAAGCSRMPTNVTALAANPAYDICSNPDDYVFWDGSHPTAEMHRSIARFMVTLVKNTSTL
ncbi:hypothetical protein DSO57_1022734 [Entomophthora muscae]|uniref:Uncharacterized protein n=1 Tax=Entomophthora muscae TaxID=34485 RepID=A0ACC2RU34_9FUNG|nr:hypothetical protein DSO57_1022734 [Entomophthora muscae]